MPIRGPQYIERYTFSIILRTSHIEDCTLTSVIFRFPELQQSHFLSFSNQFYSLFSLPVFSGDEQRFRQCISSSCILGLVFLQMASLDRGTRRVCFRNPFKRSKSPETPTIQVQRKVSFCSNTSTPTDCSRGNGSDMSYPGFYCSTRYPRKSRQRFRDSLRGNDDSDGSLIGSPGRASSFFGCFGSRTGRHSTSRGGTMHRSKTCNECIEPTDSNTTTRSTAIYNSGDRSVSMKSLRTRVASFYSVASHCDCLTDGESLRDGSLCRTKLSLSASRSGRESQSTGGFDEDDLSDFFCKFQCFSASAFQCSMKVR